MKRYRRQKYKTGVINRILGLIIVAPTIKQILFLKRCTVANEAIGTQLLIRYLVRLDISVNSPAKMPLKRDTVWTFIKIINIPDNFPRRTSGTPLHTLSNVYDVPIGFPLPL